MKKSLRLLSLLSIAWASASPYTYTNKTFLQLRSQLHNMPLETSLWHRHISNDVGNKLGLTAQASFFYHETSNESALGKYFGVARTDSILFKPTPDGITRATTFPSESIRHDSNNPATFNTEMRIKPDHKEYGVLFGIFQDLERLTDGLSLKVLLPLAYVKNEVDLCFCDDDNAEAIADIRRYFRGELTQTEDPNMQAPLRCGLIGCDESSTLFSDLLISLNYNFLEGYDHYINLYGGAIIPTGNEADGRVLFEPIVGNGGHPGLLLGTDAAATLWRKNKTSFELMWRLQWNYLFKTTQTRMLGLLSQDGSKLAWGHYRLGGEVGKKGVFPLANVLCRCMKVTVGNQVETMVALALHGGAFTLTLGADLYARQAESVEVGAFPDNTYGIAGSFYNTSEEFTEESGLENGERLITCETLDRKAPATPAHGSVKIFATFGYSGSETRYPVLFGAGVSYEFAFNNNISEGLGVWATLGASF